MGKKQLAKNAKNQRDDETVRLLQLLAATSLFNSGVTQGDIAKKLGVAKATVNGYLKGVKRISIPSET